MAEKPIRFGIIGCAEIARKLARAIVLAPNAELSAVASRTLEKASAFAKSNNFPANAKVYGSYEVLLDDPEIDAVYIPLPTSMHLKWACLAAEKGKHILLEKPVGLNVGEFDQIVAACDANGVQIIDATMWVHHPRAAKMKEFLNDKERFGKLKMMHTCFTYAADENFLKNDIRVKPDLDALGALGDAGWYCARSILWANDFELPKTVMALPDPILSDAGVIFSCGASLDFGDGKAATFHCSFFSNLTADITAIGTMGTLHLNDFIIPFEEGAASFTTSSKAWFTELATGWVPLPSQYTVSTDLPQESCLVREFARLVGNIKANGAKPDPKWPTMSRKTQLILDAVKTSIERGLKPVEIVY